MINFLNFCHQFKTLILVSVSAILKCVNVTLSVKRYRFSKLCIGATLASTITKLFGRNC